MQLLIDEDLLTDGAEAWWRSLTPGERAVYLQACWEIEQCPAPKTNAARAEAQRLVESEVEA